MSPSISVIIPTYGRGAARVIDAVNSFAAQSPDEIVVVLDGPQPRVRDALDGLDLPVPLVVADLAENVGLCLAKAEGVARATSEVVLMVDDDIVPGPGLIDRHRGFHDERSGAVLVGYVPIPAPPGWQPGQAATRLFAREYEAVTERWERHPDSILDGIYGGMVSVSRERFLAASAYKPPIRLDYYEDLDLGLRLKAVGATGYFDRSARGDHLHTRSNAGFAQEARLRGAALDVLQQRWGTLPAYVQADRAFLLTAPLRRFLRLLSHVPRLLDVVGVLLLFVLDLCGRGHYRNGEDIVARILRLVNEAQGLREAQRVRASWTRTSVPSPDFGHGGDADRSPPPAAPECEDVRRQEPVSRTISVVIPTFHRQDRLARVLAGYLAQDPDEVVVVLDGPQPDSADFLATVDDPRLRVVALDVNVGLARARVAGAEHAGGDVLLMVDDDVVPEPGFVARHRRFHEWYRRSVLAGYMPVEQTPYAPGQAAVRLYAKEYEGVIRRWIRDPHSILDGLWGGAVSLPRDLYFEAERERPSIAIPYFEDLDLGLRLKALGARAAFDPHARARHQPEKSNMSFAREAAVRARAARVLADRWGDVPSHVRADESFTTRRLRQAIGTLRRVPGLLGVLAVALQGALRACGVLRWPAGEDLSARLLRSVVELDAA